MTQPPRTAHDGAARELTPDEIVADIEAMKPRKHKVTIYQAWPRMILERERKRAQAAAPDALREALEGLVTTVDKVVNQYGDKGWAKSEMCRWLRLANREARAALAASQESEPR